MNTDNLIGGAFNCEVCRERHAVGFCKAEPRTAVPEFVTRAAEANHALEAEPIELLPFSKYKEDGTPDFANMSLSESMYGKNPEFVWQNYDSEPDYGCAYCADTGYTDQHDRCHPPNYYICDHCDAYAQLNRQPVDPKGEAGKKKAQLALIPTALNKSVAGVLQHGAEKYGIFNWRATSVCASTYVHAMMRHLDAYRDGEDADPDSGLSHLAHIAANCAILLDAESCSCLADDRYKKPNNAKDQTG